MIYIQLSEKVDAKGLMVLIKSGYSILCLPENIYGVRTEHLKVLKAKKIPFKILNAHEVPMPKVSVAA